MKRDINRWDTRRSYIGGLMHLFWEGDDISLCQMSSRRVCEPRASDPMDFTVKWRACSACMATLRAAHEAKDWQAVA